MIRGEDLFAFTPIQVAATAALNGPQDCIDEMRARYKSRRDVLIEGLNAAGWPVTPPPAWRVSLSSRSMNAVRCAAAASRTVASADSRV